MFNIFKTPKTNYSDFYDQARFKLTWRVSLTVFSIMILFTTISGILAPSTLWITLGSLVFLAVTIVITYKTRKYELPAKLFLILGTTVCSTGFYFITDKIHIVGVVWYLSIVIFGYFVLGKKWGFFGLTFFAVSLSYYMYFLFDVSIANHKEVNIYIKSFQAFNAILASTIFGYITYHFLETNRYAELQLQGVNKDLQEKKTIIESQNDLNVVMLKEIHHRVKNNLQIISSLLRLQSSEIKNETSKKYFTDSISRISTMALIHEKLYQTDLVSVNVKSYFEDLTRELKSTYPDVGLSLSIDLNITPEKLNLNTLVPLALLYNELFSNSVKHAFKSTDTGQIKLDLYQVSDDKLVFKYSDNGKWIENSDENSFGLEMIATFSEQLDGTFKRNIDSGTVYIFDLRMLD